MIHCLFDNHLFMNLMVFKIGLKICLLPLHLACEHSAAQLSGLSLSVGVLATTSEEEAIGAPPEQHGGHRGSHFVRRQMKAVTGTVPASPPPACICPVVERFVRLKGCDGALTSASHVVSHISVSASKTGLQS